MLIQHLEKTTLLDYPGKIAAVVFTYGCNLRCPYCHNPELVIEKPREKQSISQGEVIKFLKSRKNKLDGLVITGGEPTIHDDLPNFIKKVKKAVPSMKIKLDTNGTFPDRVEKMIKEKLVDYWAMDVKYEDEIYKQGLNGGMKIKNIKKSIRLIMKSGADYEFRTTVMKGMHTRKVMRGIGKLVKGSPIYYIQNFRPGKTIDPKLDSSKSFSEKQLRSFKKLMEEYVSRVEVRNY